MEYAVLSKRLLRTIIFKHPGLERLALIVRAADIKGQEQVAVEGIGLRAIAQGFAALGLSDEERLVRQFPVYDALYEYARQAP